MHVLRQSDNQNAHPQVLRHGRWVTQFGIVNRAGWLEGAAWAMQFSETISFGPFHLSPSGRLLTRGSSPVGLGARALDILIALTSHPNMVIGKNDLLAMIWPDVTVEEGSLRFHVANLRKALGDGKGGARYIETLRGRGYCFVEPVSRALNRHGEQPPIGVATWTNALPALAARISGTGTPSPADHTISISLHLIA